MDDRAMRDGEGHPEERGVTARGEAAWKEARERVAERNEQARRAGRRRREAFEARRREALRAAERARLARLRSRREGEGR